LQKEIDACKVKKYWTFAFWIYVCWTVFRINMGYLEVDQGPHTFIDRILGSMVFVVIVGAIFACISTRNTIGALLYIIVMNVIFIYQNLLFTAIPISLVNIAMSAFLIFTTYKLLLTRILVKYKIKDISI